MTIQELNHKYNFHDSSIINIDYSSEKKQLIIILIFCYWAQTWYKEGDPELMKLQVTMDGIESYDGPSGRIDYYGIGNDEIIDGNYHLFVMNDFEQKYYDFYLRPTEVKIEILEQFNEE